MSVSATFSALTAAPTATAVFIDTPTPTLTATVTPLPTETPSPTLLPTDIPSPTETMDAGPQSTRTLAPLPGTGWLIDLHMHTTCSDGDHTYEEMVQGAIDLGLDLIAVTDHIICPDVIQACLNENRLVCIPGQEVSPAWHIVGLGITQPVSPDQPYADIVAAIHNQGGLAMAAHPYTRPWRFDESTLIGIGLDLMECWLSNPEENQHQIDLGEQYGIACTYDSDAHEVLDLGLRYMDCSVEIRNLDELNSALHNHQCQPSL